MHIIITNRTKPKVVIVLLFLMGGGEDDINLKSDSSNVVVMKLQLKYALKKFVFKSKFILRAKFIYLPVKYYSIFKVS